MSADVGYEPTTTDDFRAFEAEVLRWIDRFGLHEWKVWIAHDKIDGDAAAHCAFQSNSRVARIVLGLRKSKAPYEDDVRLNAFHEVCHVLLADLYGIAMDREATRQEYERAEHAVIRRLEQVLYNGDASKTDR